MRKEIAGCVIRYTSINSIVISVRIAAKPKRITIIQIYAQTFAYTDEEIKPATR